MSAIKWIAIWGIIATLAAVAGGVLASLRNRDHSAWAAWCFVLPPALIVLLLLPAYKGTRLPRRDPDDEDHDHERGLA